MTPANFAATLENLVHEWTDARVTAIARQDNGRISVKFENERVSHWLNYHESILSPDLARQVAPNVALRLTEWH